DDGDAEDLVQLRRGAQDPEAVHDHHGAGDGEGAEHGLKGDARTDELHQPADAAEEQALQACVGEHQGRRGLLLEDVHQGGDEAPIRPTIMAPVASTRPSWAPSAPPMKPKTAGVMATTKPTTMTVPRVAVMALSASREDMRPVSWPVAAGRAYIASSCSGRSGPKP